MARTKQAETTFHVQYKMSERNEDNWTACRQAIIDKDKGWFESRLSGLTLNLASTPSTVSAMRTNDQNTVVPVTYPVTTAGRKAILELLGLDAVDQVFAAISDPSDEVAQSKRVIWDAYLQQQADKAVRLHYLQAETGTMINYASTSKFKTIGELALFDTVEELSQLFDMQLRRMVVDDDSIRFQVIQTRNPVADPSQPGGQFYGLIDFVLSETKLKNQINLGFYQSECDNGCIFGQDEALSIQAGSSAKAGTKWMLKACFEAIEHATYNRSERLARAINIPFEFSHVGLIESLANVAGAQLTYRGNLADKFSAWLEQNASTDHGVSKHSLADVVNEITKVGHQSSLSVHEQLKLERIGGQVLEKLIAV